MKSNENGIALTGAELGALLKVASKEKNDRDKAAVLFIAKGDRCYARATNGQIAVEVDGDGDGDLDGEWLVTRDFLEEAKKLVAGVKQIARLMFHGASLHEARIEENGLEVGSFHSPNDAAVAQHSFPNIDQSVKLPGGTRKKIAHCASIGIAYLSTIEAIGKAAGVEFADMYAPKDRDSPFSFRCGDGGDTIWTGSINPLPTAASSAGDEEEAA